MVYMNLSDMEDLEKAFLGVLQMSFCPKELHGGNLLRRSFLKVHCHGVFPKRYIIYLLTINWAKRVREESWILKFSCLVA